MKLMKGKINNKGFTLIELLAVIVILAVVMGVATTSVLSAMNNSRKSQLQNSASSAADAFRTAYAEASLTNATEILGATIPTNGKGTVNFTDTIMNNLNITSANYTTASFVYFDSATSTLQVCLVANTSGSYYVAAASATTAKATGVGSNSLTGMWACSNNKNSWSN